MSNKWFITNDSLTTLINTISSNINTISEKGNTICCGLNKLQAYIGKITILGKINLNCNKINKISLNVIKPQTEFINNIEI